MALHVATHDVVHWLAAAATHACKCFHKMQ